MTNTNEENGFDNPAKGRLNPDGSATKYPYIHFTEAENLRSLPNGVVLPSEESTEETKTTEEQILQVPQTNSDDEIVDSKIQESSEN